VFVAVAVVLLAFASGTQASEVGAPPATSASPDAGAVAPEPRVTQDDVIEMMSQVPTACALARTCSRYQTVLVNGLPAARAVAWGIADAVNAAWQVDGAENTAGRVLCTGHQDAALLVVYAVYDSNVALCNTWRAGRDTGQVVCNPGAAAWWWLRAAARARDDCMSDHGNLGKDPPVLRMMPDDDMATVATGVTESMAPLFDVARGSCMSKEGRRESDQRFRVAGFITGGDPFEINDDGYVEPYWDWRPYFEHAQEQWTWALAATDRGTYASPQWDQWSAFDAMGLW